MSFPSGHSSTTFCGCVLLVRYAWSCITNTCIDPFKKRRWLMVALSPLIVAYFVAASRVYDNYHFVGDGKSMIFRALELLSFPLLIKKSRLLASKQNLTVIGGSVIGTANALVFHRFWLVLSTASD